MNEFYPVVFYVIQDLFAAKHIEFHDPVERIGTLPVEFQITITGVRHDLEIFTLVRRQDLFHLFDRRTIMGIEIFRKDKVVIAS